MLGSLSPVGGDERRDAPPLSESAFAYERIEVVSGGVPAPMEPPSSLFAIPSSPQTASPLAIPGNVGGSAASPSGLPLGVAWNPSGADASVSTASVSDEGMGVVLIGSNEVTRYGAAASELPRGEAGFLSADGVLEIPDWQVVFVPDDSEGASSDGIGDFQTEIELEIPQGTRDFDLSQGELELPGDPNERIGEPDLISVNTVNAHCDACDGERWNREGREPLPVCSDVGWETVSIEGHLLPGSLRRLAEAQLYKAQAVYGQCCIEVEMPDLEVWDDDGAAALIGENLYLDELNILQDQLGFFQLSSEQFGLLERGVTPQEGGAVPVWWARRTRESEVGYIMRAHGMDERTVVLSGGLEANYEANNIVLAHELGHVLLEGQLEGDHHDYMHPRNLMASGRINTGGGDLTASQCDWMRTSPYLTP